MENRELERLVLTLSPAVTRLAYARTGNLEDAEDVTQEVFLRLMRSDKAFRDDEHCKAWLLRVTINCTRDLFRSPWHRHTVSFDESDLPSVPMAGPEAGGLLEAVFALPVKYRTVIHLYYYEELTSVEIAALLGVREAAIRTQLSRARAMLRQDLKEDGSYV